MQSKTFKVNKTLTSARFSSALAVIGSQNSIEAGLTASRDRTNHPRKKVVENTKAELVSGSAGHLLGNSATTHPTQVR